MDDTDTPGVSVDSSGMSVVTVDGSTNSIPWWAWLVMIGGVVYLLQAKPR